MRKTFVVLFITMFVFAGTLPTLVMAQTTCTPFDTSFPGSTLDTNFWKSSITNQGTVTQHNRLDITVSGAGSYAGISTANLIYGDMSTELNIESFVSNITNSGDVSTAALGLLDQPYGKTANNQVDLVLTKDSSGYYARVITLINATWQPETGKTALYAGANPRIKITRLKGQLTYAINSGNGFTQIASGTDIFGPGVYIGFAAGATGPNETQANTMKVVNFNIMCWSASSQTFVSQLSPTTTSPTQTSITQPQVTAATQSGATDTQVLMIVLGILLAFIWSTGLFVWYKARQKTVLKPTDV